MSADLDTHVSSLNIYLQSRDAQISTGIGNSNKTWYLATPVVPPRPNIRMLGAVTDFQMAYSWYLIRAGINDTFIFELIIGGVPTIYTCVISEGNYDINTFLSKMVNQIFVAQGVPGTTTLTWSVQTNKLTLKDTAATSITIFSGENGTTLDTEMGMNEIGDVNVSGGVGQTIDFPNMIDFAGIPNVYVMFPTLGLNNRDGRGETNLCLAKIPVATRPQGFIYLPNKEYVFVTLDDREIKRVQIQLQDDIGNDLDLHGVGWSLTLSIHFQYQRFPDANESLTLTSGKPHQEETTADAQIIVETDHIKEHDEKMEEQRKDIEEILKGTPINKPDNSKTIKPKTDKKN